MKLKLLLTVLVCVFFSVSFGQEAVTEDEQFSLEPCGEAQILTQSAEDDKLELEFNSDEKMAKCFSDLDDQMNEAGWERVKGDNNIYKSDFYRIEYTNEAAEEVMLVVRKSDNAFKVILDF